MWFTETPWPPMMLLAVAAAVLVAAFVSTQRAKYLGFAAAVGLLAGGVWWIEREIVTERERVEAAVVGVVQAFQRKDLEGTLSFIAGRSVDLRVMAGGAMQLVTAHEDVHVTDVRVRMTNLDTRAISEFRVNGTFSVALVGESHVPTRWELTWQKEGEDWRIVSVRRLDPITGEEVAILDDGR